MPKPVPGQRFRSVSTRTCTVVVTDIRQRDDGWQVELHNIESKKFYWIGLNRFRQRFRRVS